MSFERYFDRAYIVNLPERSDRRQGMNRELKRTGFKDIEKKFVFFPAIKPIEKYAFPSNGVLGCYLSHLEILKLAQQEGLQNVVLMEDDLAIPKNFLALSASLCEQLENTDWDMVLLGHLPYRHPNLESPDEGQLRVIADQKSHCSVEPYTLAARGTHFYAVNRRAFSGLIDFLEDLLEKRKQQKWFEVDGVIDNLDGAYLDSALYMFKMQQPENRCFIASPSLGWQRNSSSDISPGRFDNVAWLRSATDGLRSLKYNVERIFN